MNALYINDDGQNVLKHFEENSMDLLFSCPPYFDLEHYSDLPNDASNAPTYEQFIKILENAFVDSIKCLRENRFAVIVVGDIRNKITGFYYDFVGDIKRIFINNGVKLYNELILVECIGSAIIRAAGNMASRKVTKTHQNVLVFYKGDPKNIKQQFNKIEYDSEDLELFGLDE